MKTKLGISVAMFAAGTYLLGLFSGYLALLLIAGYVVIILKRERIAIPGVLRRHA